MSSALTKLDIVEALSTNVFSNKREAKEFVESVFEEIRLALSQGSDVKIPRFGNFLVKAKKERPGRNLKTGEVVSISARRVVVFHPSPLLKV
ncbi:MAG: integration host factor subunit alpha [Gammaproteobacteria bacterium]